MRQVKFSLQDGGTMDLEVHPRFEGLVRDELGLPAGSDVTDADIKRYFVHFCQKAGE